MPHLAVECGCPKCKFQNSINNKGCLSFPKIRIFRSLPNTAWCVLKDIVSPFGDDMLAGASPVPVHGKKHGAGGSGRQVAGNRCSRVTDYVEALYLWKKRLNKVDKIILSDNIKEIAESNGIDVLGFATASEFSGYALSHSIRRDPKLSLSDAETIIVAGIYIGGITLPAWSNPWYGRTSRLYLSGYFFDVIEPLEPIVSYLRDEGYKAIICNSSTSEGSIIPLKLAAIRAGLGWQGKHSLLVRNVTWKSIKEYMMDKNLRKSNWRAGCSEM